MDDISLHCNILSKGDGAYYIPFKLLFFCLKRGNFNMCQKDTITRNVVRKYGSNGEITEIQNIPKRIMHPFDVRHSFIFVACVDS